MKTRLLTLLTLIAAITVPSMIPSQQVQAESPQLFIGAVGDNGYVGMTSDGQVHYTITNDGFRYYSTPGYGMCRKHHRRHRCRYVAPPRPKHHKHKPPKPKKHYKKHHKKHHHDD